MNCARLLLVLALAPAACSLGTSRPPFAPMPEARVGDLEAEVPAATERLAAALREAGIPLARVKPADGFLESAWFDAESGQPVGGRPLGEDVVRVRGWVTPSAHGSSEIRVETVYRPFADPSRPPRELERSVAYAHPVRAKVREAYRAIGARTVTDEPDAVSLAARRAAGRRPEPAPVTADSARRDTAPADTTAVPAVAVADTARADTARADTARAAAPAAGQQARPPAARPPVEQQQAGRPPVQQQPAQQPAAPPPAAPVRNETPVASVRGYAIQVAATRDSAAADLAARRLGAMGIEPNILLEAGLFKVRSGVYPSQTAAQTLLGRVRRSFPDAFIVRGES
ncbi:MAG TPA: SPOR domain-containing protein [Gemmatimonadales bacterium]